ncbi:importin subunit beta-3 [Stygiomarasmius scandens]|uniref:Importin subunit beta-3 n=1 Tax=Marasmiellus scandens TaxID=2682957 RepID=A0ABR1IZ95_9AGAR
MAFVVVNMRLLKNQRMFAFCAILATMAIATSELCFMNLEMLQRNIKQMLRRRTDLEEVIQEQYHQQLFLVLIPTLEDPEPRWVFSDIEG